MYLVYIIDNLMARCVARNPKDIVRQVAAAKVGEVFKPESLGVPKKTQLLNFQVAPKNCGDATLEKPKNVWV